MPKKHKARAKQGKQTKPKRKQHVIPRVKRTTKAKVHHERKAQKKALENVAHLEENPIHSVKELQHQDKSFMDEALELREFILKK